ncbi:unnamed protein product [Clonostachys rosea]|uniref:Retrotransposon gag domain-containing protein n=1 Tax=Bionectria ochroleuca TaxID=29856 RepID=A0ABY6UD01_BIOOC|nr:unnamed protein product [Clonostachys rosea]VUC31744.1 unnamed protein product [Clonostachys rosea]VUC35213.1 unnamed protein product [Clonostachys rosea]
MAAILKEPSDWDVFEQAAIMKAASERVLHLMQLNNTSEFNARRREEPLTPEFSQYKAKVRTTDESGRSSFVRGEQPATSYVELLDEDKEAYKVEQTSHRTLLAQFNREADGIPPHYTETCAPALFHTEERDNIYLFFKNLKDACGINEADRRKRAREAYSDSLRHAEKSKTDWQAWINNWEKVMRVARLRKVPDALNSPEWFSDLEEHLDSRFESLLRIVKSQNQSKIDDGTYEPAEFIKSFRDELRTFKRGLNKETKPKVSKGSFGPTFQGENPPDEKRKRQTEGEITEHKDKQQKKTREDRPDCILCGKKHKGANTKDCWLLFPENLPPNLDNGRPRSDKWKRRLEEVPEARKLYNKLVEAKGEQH